MKIFKLVEVNILYDNSREKEKFMPKRGTLNNSKAKRLLDFEPNFSIEDGYLKYISWYKNFWKNIE